MARHSLPTACLLCVALLGTPLALRADTLAPFASDGCSSFPDGTLAEQSLWLRCCTAHDLAYWQGGTYGQRLEADLALRRCVNELGEPAVAAVMLAGVRVGGSPLWPTRFRWGYGWTWPRFYGSLDSEELAQVRIRLHEAGAAP